MSPETSSGEGIHLAGMQLQEVADGLAELTDLVVVMDADTNIVYANAFALTFLGWSAEEIIGRSIAEFLHPDDFARAVEVVARIEDQSLGVSLTPAEYRLLRKDGTWCPVEINGAPAGRMADRGPEPVPMLMLGRYSGDHDLQNQMLQLLTSGAPIAEALALVPRFGSWRHPHDHYAVVTFESDGEAFAVGSDLAVSLVGLDRGQAPWTVAAADGVERVWSTDDLPPAVAAQARASGLISCWVVPVPDPRVGSHAVVVAWSREHGPAESVHQFSIEAMVRALTVILQWAAQLADLEWAATHDPLTGTFNRNQFFAALTAALDERGGLLAVLYVDLDGFKAVNDEFGHTTGDALLRTVAERLERATSTDHVLGRLGGDEFAVICPAIDSIAAATAAAGRIIDAMTEPLDLGVEELVVGVSVGVAVAEAGTIAPDQLVERADHALYAAKSAGRGRWHLGAVSGT